MYACDDICVCMNEKPDDDIVKDWRVLLYSLTSNGVRVLLARGDVDLAAAVLPLPPAFFFRSFTGTVSLRVGGLGFFAFVIFSS